MKAQALKWLHRFGYLTTIIVLLELVGAGILFSIEWRRYLEMRARSMEASRTHAGPFKPGPFYYQPDERDLYASLPPLEALNKNGLRFVAAPGLRDSWFAYALTAPPGWDRAQGELRIFPHPEDDGAKLETGRLIRFSMPRPDAEKLLNEFKQLTDGFEGEVTHCLDGTGVNFELVTADGVTSGGGNAACSDHYGQLSTLVLSSVRRIIPEDLRPVNHSWRPAQPHRYSEHR